ncbi:unnamed protein product [Kuraishia capsulata CBS 1993]|uniref:ADF-H domain-containing protein n=1 Tax=Kuraishia capsulata CBS 1993 TaxID=1382522 RepID=W6MRI0_9ASCO|nr:uncharacterized protein KUCA_T00003831001 [Kuraishia capsulata CBS 1993]CDK27852.1 unnamed protein product [Kuraishia capsulata CBS 1993]
MSSQSGITASPELIAAFKDYIDTSSRALIVKIVDEKLLPHEIIAGSQSLGTDLDLVRSKLSDSEACYLVVKNEGTNKHTFVSFVPDYAHVKSKMLYASTKNAIIRELGLEFFEPVVFVNELEEISSAGWKEISDHESSSGPLTASEESLAKVKEQETISLLSADNRRRELAQHGSEGTLNLKIASELLSKASSLQKGDYVNAEILPDESVALRSHGNVTSVSGLANQIPSSSPNYSVYKYGDSKVAFILTCPSGSKVRDRMLYAASKSAFMKQLPVEFERTIEAGDASEIDVGEFEEKLVEETVSNGLRFSKPRGPKRR